VAVVEVVGAVEVVEVVEGGDTTVVIEGVRSTADNEFGSRDGGGRDRESRKSDDESAGEFSEHDDDLKWLNGIKSKFAISTNVRPTLEELNEVSKDCEWATWPNKKSEERKTKRKGIERSEQRL